ncbi:uncharacterized protein LOC115241992 [Formica exsecta]|uniref:uncharacterized protein LOC115241992 n=1 Tax=Formica exsecta TaxID=72781 RepID=UPI0011434A50|nr:uncharacterized protein LOC115241992 [Formica exsecta]
MPAQILRALKGKRTTVKAQCTRTRNAIDAINPQTVDITYVKQRKEKFVEYWNLFNVTQGQIDEFLATDMDLENVEELRTEQETEYVNFEENYFCIAGKIERLLSRDYKPVDGNEARARSNGEQAPIAEGSVRDISQILLPKIVIPKFNGNYEDWYPFYNTFESMIHANTRLTNSQRFHYLISSLEGDAAHVIESLEITPDNYVEALDLLKQRYDDKRVIAQEHIKALYDLPTVTKGNHTALRKLLDDVLRHLRSLKSLCRPTEHWDDLVVHLVVTKLDSSLVSEWENHIPTDEIPTLKQITDFLAHKCKAMSVLAKKVSSDTSAPNPRKNNKFANVHLTTSIIYCAHCKGRHHIFQCSSFLKLSSADRNKEARIKGLCLNCLRSISHQAKDCKSLTCQTCNKKHNTLLHVQERLQRDTESTSQSHQSNNTNTVTLNHHITQDKYYQVILSTAVVNAIDQSGNSHTCRVLLDSGSQSSFITEKLASKLNLTPRQINIAITGINNSQTHSCHVVNVRIKSRHMSFSQEVECYILNAITENLPRTRININDFKIPNNIRLADPHFHKPNEIDMLMGVELFWQLLCVGQIQKHKNQPIFQKTQLGWIVSGKAHERVHPQNLKYAVYQLINKLIRLSPNSGKWNTLSTRPHLILKKQPA